VGVSVRLAGWPIVRVELPDAAPTRAVVIRPPEPPMAESLIMRTVAKDAFRVSRHPSAVAYDPLRLAEPTAPPPPKPGLRLTGLVSGSEPAAVLEGLPGADGPRVVHVGDVIAGLKILRIDVDRVRIAGMDTVWVLAVRKP